ncbi:hypothetical protein IGI37_000520 [Enterococcus sp. AZ194]|uniref:hypothetical protein n=1 Tax=Enterococcus sp. AZ194 TaxID=2774629 RepID=UPI003F272276
MLDEADTIKEVNTKKLSAEQAIEWVKKVIIAENTYRNSEYQGDDLETALGPDQLLYITYLGSQGDVLATYRINALGQLQKKLSENDYRTISTKYLDTSEVKHFIDTYLGTLEVDTKKLNEEEILAWVKSMVEAEVAYRGIVLKNTDYKLFMEDNLVYVRAIEPRGGYSRTFRVNSFGKLELKRQDAFSIISEKYLDTSLISGYIMNHRKTKDIAPSNPSAATDWLIENKTIWLKGNFEIIDSFRTQNDYAPEKIDVNESYYDLQIKTNDVNSARGGLYNFKVYSSGRIDKELGDTGYYENIIFE